MYAIIEDSGSQMKVSPGDIFEIDLKDGVKPDDAIVFDRVLLVGSADTETETNAEAPTNASIGTPYVEGATVSAKVLEETKGVKLDVIKYKRRKGFRKKIGHRQKYLTVQITAINA